jgi:hypothetical protein
MSEETETPEETADPTVPVFDKTPRTKPKHMVVGETFIAQTSDGELKVPLRFKTRLFRKLVKSDGDEVEQFLDLIEGIGDEATLAKIDELDIAETARMAGVYFTAWREKQRATPGEARRSSRS